MGVMLNLVLLNLALIVKTIFIMWLQGFDYAPDIVKRCVDTWEFHHRNWNIVKTDESNQIFRNLQIPCEGQRFKSP